MVIMAAQVCDKLNTTESCTLKSWIYLFIFLAAPCGLWGLSFPTKDQTQAFGSESVES